jgi:NADH:ubiquinone oxidoreductase subunit 5 (subunit L)/multisubunit Na+/H+ antiporter MnhA subunit
MVSTMSLGVVATAIPALPLIAAIVSAASGAGRARWTGWFGAATAGGGLVLAAALAIRIGSGSPIEILWRSWSGDVLAGLRIDRLTVLLLLLIYGVSTVAQCFAVRYLHGDRRAAWFSASAGLLTATTAGMVMSATLVGLAVCWTLSGGSLCLLLATYPQLAAARQGIARTSAAFAIGDLALWSAVGVVTASLGSVEVSRLGAAVSGQPPALIAAVAMLIVLAALARSAQMPFHRWLPATLAAPTPASALLHAGVVNGGGVLLVRTGGLVGQSGIAMAAAVTAGALTLLYGSAAMLTKADVKGALVHSTSAQMGFMIVTCGLGLYGAAVFHLIAHGLYKSTLFLNSGSALSLRDRETRWAPTPPKTRVRSVITVTAAAGLSALAAVIALALVPAAHHTDGVALLFFGWVTAAALTVGWLRRQRSARATTAAVGALIAIAAGYLTVVAAVTGFIAEALPPSPQTPAAWPLAAVLTALAVLLAVRGLPIGGRTDGLHRRVYAAALNAGYVGTSTKGALQ